MQDQILDMLLKKDEITWQNILYDLVKSEQMDPWDIDVSLLAQKYLKIVKKLQEFNFFISGKVILASAILLRLKSDKLLLTYISSFDNRLFDTGEIEELDEFEQKGRVVLPEKPRLTIKTPTARKRKVSIQDLVGALEKALEVDKRRTLRKISVERATEHLRIPEKKIDIRQKIKELYSKIVEVFNTKKEKVSFFGLVNSERKEDKIATFIPLLHLSNQEKVFLEQMEHFGDIDIHLKQRIENE